MSSVLTSAGSECHEPVGYLDVNAEWKATHRRNGERRAVTADPRSLLSKAEIEYREARAWLLDRVGMCDATMLCEALDALLWIKRHPTFHGYRGMFKSVARYAARQARA